MYSRLSLTHTQVLLWSSRWTHHLFISSSVLHHFISVNSTHLLRYWSQIHWPPHTHTQWMRRKAFGTLYPELWRRSRSDSAAEVCVCVCVNRCCIVASCGMFAYHVCVCDVRTWRRGRRGWRTACRWDTHSCASRTWYRWPCDRTPTTHSQSLHPCRSDTGSHPPPDQLSHHLHTHHY